MMYDRFSQDYDRFVNWSERLKVELPFIETQLNALPGAGRPRVLDAACGTGMHAIALAEHGYPIAGADLSPPMIIRARLNAAAAGVAVPFEAAGFGDLARTFGAETFDAVLCLGNSLPHTLPPEEMATALHDFAACLRPEGILLVQNRNFDAVLETQERWMEPQAHREGPIERIFLRFYDYEPEGLITFNVITLQREGDGPWSQQVNATRLRPLRQSEQIKALATAGFADIASYGNMGGVPFDAATSGNLVMTARKRGSLSKDGA